ncbi:MAG TPA: hypothetical protein VLB09_05610, partial [Nitrospiria bacterium]|nr:hypothetical protein [Nitrospiria bacterium]
VQRLVLQAGPEKVDLENLFKQVVCFVKWYVSWFQEAFPGQDKLAADVCLRIKIQPVRYPLP